MIKQILLSTFGLLLLANCQNQNVSAENTTIKNSSASMENASNENQSSAAGLTYLKEGQTTTMKANKTKVTFKNMKEDSRCPKDVNCVWAGVATAEIEIIGEMNRPLTILLSTMDDANKGYNKTANFEGYNYTLVEVSPELTSDKGFKATQGQYKIGLKIEKGTSENPILQRN